MKKKKSYWKVNWTRTVVTIGVLVCWMVVLHFFPLERCPYHDFAFCFFMSLFLGGLIFATIGTGFLGIVLLAVTILKGKLFFIEKRWRK